MGHPMPSLRQARQLLDLVDDQELTRDGLQRVWPLIYPLLHNGADLVGVDRDDIMEVVDMKPVVIHLENSASIRNKPADDETVVEFCGDDEVVSGDLELIRSGSTVDEDEVYSLGQRAADVLLAVQDRIPRQWRKHTLVFSRADWLIDSFDHIAILFWVEKTQSWAMNFVRPSELECKSNVRYVLALKRKAA